MNNYLSECTINSSMWKENIALNAKHNEVGNLFLGDQQSGKTSASLIFNGLSAMTQVTIMQVRGMLVTRK